MWSRLPWSLCEGMAWPIHNVPYVPNQPHPHMNTLQKKKTNPHSPSIPSKTKTNLNTYTTSTKLFKKKSLSPQHNDRNRFHDDLHKIYASAVPPSKKELDQSPLFYPLFTQIADDAPLHTQPQLTPPPEEQKLPQEPYSSKRKKHLKTPLVSPREAGNQKPSTRPF